MSFANYWLPAVAVLIVLAGVAVGWRDLARFRFRRVRAIAAIGFTEAVRRRILWITPLAILGVVSVTQFTHPADELDAIRQTIKYCLFASGLIVVVAAILLACTNLPKEIENRVIYTIVTKPTTRLEIVLGKVLGFAAVSGAILLIMGVFSYGYLELRAWRLQKSIRATLDAGLVETTNEVTLRHYAQAGLLSTKALAWPESLEMLARVPTADGPKWMAGGELQYYVAPFDLTPPQKALLRDVAEQDPAKGGLRFAFLVCNLRLVQSTAPGSPATQPITGPNAFPDLPPATQPATQPGTQPSTQAAATRPAGPSIPQVQVQAFDQNGVALTAEEFKPDREYNAGPASAGGGGARAFAVPLTPRGLMELAAAEQVSVQVSAGTSGVEYGVEPASTYLAIYQPMAFHPRGSPPQGQPVSVGGPVQLYMLEQQLLLFDPVALAPGAPLGFAPLPPGAPPGGIGAVAGGRAVALPDANYFWLRPTDTIVAATKDHPGVAAPPRMLSRPGRQGMQLRGVPPEQGTGPIGLFRFEGADVAAGGIGADGKVALQLRLFIERAGDLDVDQSGLSTAAVQVRNRRTGEMSSPITCEPETSRIIYVDVPARYMTGGDFDVIVRGLTHGQYLGLSGPQATTPSVAVVTANTTFTGNLFKSLLILWLLSVMVVVVSVFCSTFLSWPIAVVLTVVLLFGHWAVEELGDALAPGNSRTGVAEIFGVRDPAKTRVVTSSVEALSTLLRGLGAVLPDVARFPVIEDIDRGVSIPLGKMWRAAGELAGYGLPLLVMTYLILRKKEVAP